MTAKYERIQKGIQRRIDELKAELAQARTERDERLTEEESRRLAFLIDDLKDTISESLTPIRTVLGKYCSVDTHISDLEITEAWAALDELKQKAIPVP